ncbi:DUF421 domain-containing protein [Halalkalibacter alkalisediminis]|uniref:DUF421 domain-containing protein n=1 Tax=Halalkalibacter alkalisediminis TaxID=935616 RepID=A0ABV6NC75_9BACI
MVISGFMLLRLSGRKSIAQMTIPTTVVVISIGNIIVQPIIEDSKLNTVMAIAVFMVVLIFVEYIQVKFNSVEKFITGTSAVVIQDGEIVVENLKKYRLTVDKLEAELRQYGVTDYNDVKVALLEPNGRIGIELTDDAKPLTVGEFKQMLGIQNKKEDVHYGELFAEVMDKKHTNVPPTKLD